MELQKSTEKGLTPKQLTENALIVVSGAKEILIVTVEDYSFADLMLKEVKGWIKILDDEEKKITRPLLEGIENARALFREPKQKANDAKNILNTRMVEWAEEQKRKEREEERQLQEIARKRAEEEALQQALEAEAAGEKEEAQKIIEEPVYVPPIKIVSEVPKSKESHIRETWSADVFDPMIPDQCLLITVKAIAEGKAPLQAVQYDMTFLNGQARSYKQGMNIPGVRAVSKKTQI